MATGGVWNLFGNLQATKIAAVHPHVLSSLSQGICRYIFTEALFPQPGAKELPSQRLSTLWLTRCSHHCWCVFFVLASSKSSGICALQWFPKTKWLTFFMKQTAHNDVGMLRSIDTRRPAGLIHLSEKDKEMALVQDPKNACVPSSFRWGQETVMSRVQTRGGRSKKRVGCIPRKQIPPGFAEDEENACLCETQSPQANILR